MKDKLWQIYEKWLKFIRGEASNENTRNEWIKKELEQIEIGKKILDAGAGQLKWKDTCKHLDYVSQDFCEYKGKGNGKGMQNNEWDTSGIDIVSDIIDIPVEASSFDAVLCSEVFEHIVNPELAVKEFSRILKREGILLLTVPFASLTHFAPYHFYSGFNEYWLERCLSDNGFEIESIVRNGDYYTWLRQELLRLSDVAKKYSHKNLYLTKVWITLLVFSMKRLIRSENNSGELLCFGYFVKARKVDKDRQDNEKF